MSEKNLAPATIKSYGFAYKHYLNYLKENNIEYARTKDVINYREERRGLGDSQAWIYIQICALKGLYSYLRLNQKRLNLPLEYSYDIMTQIKNESIKPRLKKTVLTVQQAKHLLLHLKDTRIYLWHYRDYAIIYLMLVSGLRAFEIINAKREDLKTVDGRLLLFIRESNVQVSEFVKIAKGAEEALNDYLKLRFDDNPYLFITNKNPSPKLHLSRTFFMEMFKRILKSTGMDDLGLTPHSLRHTAAVVNLLRGGSVEATRQLMRHAYIKSTLVYQDHLDHLSDDSEHQIEAFIFREAPLSFYDYYIGLF